GYSAAMQGDKIVVAGYGFFAGNYGFALARYNSDGTLDTGFGDGGTVHTDFGQYTVGQSVAVQGDGKLVVVGYSRDSDFNFTFALVRYNSDGSLDTGFGSGGKIFPDFEQ